MTEGTDVREVDDRTPELVGKDIAIVDTAIAVTIIVATAIVVIHFPFTTLQEPQQFLGPRELEVHASDIGVDGTFSDFADAVDGFRAGAPADERVMCGATGEAKRESMFGFHVAFVEYVEQQLCREVEDVASGHDE